MPYGEPYNVLDGLGFFRKPRPGQYPATKPARTEAIELPRGRGWTPARKKKPYMTRRARLKMWREVGLGFRHKSKKKQAVMKKILTKRPTDPITRGATIVEHVAEAPVIIKAIKLTPTAAPIVEVETLPGISPLEVEKYELDVPTGTVYPVLKQEESYDAPYKLDAPTYDDLEYDPYYMFPDESPGWDVSYWDEEFIYGLGDLGGFLDVFVSAAKKVKKVVVKPIKYLKKKKPFKYIKKKFMGVKTKFKSAKEKRRKAKALKKIAKRGGLTPEEEATLAAGGAIRVDGETLTIADIQGLLADLPPGLRETAEGGGLDDTIKFVTGPPEPAKIPSWALPVGLAVGGYILYKKKVI